MNVKQRQNIERRIVRQILKDALAAGYRVSVHDGEDWVVSKSTHGPSIFAAMFSVDEETLVFRDASNATVGQVWLVYGNDGYDVVCDYTANEKTETLLAGALALAGKLEEQYG